MPKAAREIPLPALRLSRESDTPLGVQLYKGLRQLLLNGQLRPGSALPATRTLAAELGVSRNTVLSAYEQLTLEGYLTGKTGSGTRVALTFPNELASANIAGARARRASPQLFFSKRGELLASRPNVRVLVAAAADRPFASGLPDISAFPVQTWTRLTAKYSGRRYPGLLWHGDPAGYRPLRAAICDHIQAARGVRCNADQVFVVNGSQQALDLCARLLVDPGDVAAVEEPSYPGAVVALQGAGVEIVSLPVDDEGANIAAMKSRQRVRLIFVTPSHQYPLGVTMSISRRLHLLDWARRNRTWVIEDDYDSEFRYHSRPLPSLQGLDAHGYVIYVGSFSKTMFPSLRLGFMVLPESLIEGFRRARAVVDGHSTLIEQAALAEFIDGGHFTRHIRRMKELYKERQLALFDAADRQLAGRLTITRPEGGMHVVGWLRTHENDVAVAHASVTAGVNCRPIAMCYQRRSHPPGLMLGFAAFTPNAIRVGVEKLAAVLERR
jgi:GntR family transcriptional regulator/MocR family aminotransferase